MSEQDVRSNGSCLPYQVNVWSRNDPISKRAIGRIPIARELTGLMADLVSNDLSLLWILTYRQHAPSHLHNDRFQPLGLVHSDLIAWRGYARRVEFLVMKRIELVFWSWDDITITRSTEDNGRYARYLRRLGRGVEFEHLDHAIHRLQLGILDNDEDSLPTQQMLPWVPFPKLKPLSWNFVWSHRFRNSELLDLGLWTWPEQYLDG